MALASKLGISFSFDWDTPRSVEGFYALEAGVELSSYRIKHMAPYVDICWMETPTADVNDAKDLIDRVRVWNKDIMLAYNLSPSFNWS